MDPTVTDTPSFEDPWEAALKDLETDIETVLSAVKTPQEWADAAQAGNAVDHGMRSERHFPGAMEESIKRCLAELLDAHSPTNLYELRLVVEIAKGEAKLEKATALEIADIFRIQEQALNSWDSDRRDFVDKLGSRLARDPGRVQRAVERSKQGVDWLVEKWVRLKGIIAERGFVDVEQRTLIHDLRGIELELREGSTEVPKAGDGPGLAALCDSELQRLRALQENWLCAKDERWRQMAACGMPYDADAETRRVWRYAADARRMRDRPLALLLRLRSQGMPPAPRTPPPSGPKPSPGPQPRPEPRPKPDLPASPVMSPSDATKLCKQSLEADVHITKLACDALKAARAEAAAEPPVAATTNGDVPHPEPAPTPKLFTTPAAILDRAAEASSRKLQEAKRRRQRAEQKKARKANRGNKR